MQDQIEYRYRWGELGYLDLLEHIMTKGSFRPDRTGVGCRDVFGAQLKFDLQVGFPLLTTKKVWFKGVAEELLWMISGSTNIKPLQAKGVRIWDEWADEGGDLGPVYGQQWRSWVVNPDYDTSTYTIDQLKVCIDGIKQSPFSRRHIVTAWDPASVDKMALPPCHMMFQFNVREQVESFTDMNQDCEFIEGPVRYLDCHMYQRSADMFLGVPFNIASYSLLTQMVAAVCGLNPGNFIHSFGSAHVYSNHEDQVREQLSRTMFELPTLELPQYSNIDLYKYEDLKLINYQSHGTITADVAV